MPPEIGSTVGNANIRVTVDDSAVKPGMDRVQRTVDEKVSAEGIIGDASKSLGPLRKLLGILGSATGTFAAFYAFGSWLRDTFNTILETGTERATSFMAALNSTDSKTTLEAIDAKLQQINGQIAANSESWVDWTSNLIGGDTTSKLQEQRAELEKHRAVLAQSVNLLEKRKQHEKEMAEALKHNADLESQMLEGNDAIRSERDKDVAEVNKKRASATDQALIDEYNKTVALLYKIANKRFEIAREAAAKEERLKEQAYQLELERAQKQADAVEKAYANAIEGIRQAAANLFPVSQITTSIEQINTQLQAIARQIRPTRRS